MSSINFTTKCLKFVLYFAARMMMMMMMMMIIIITIITKQLEQLAVENRLK